MERVTRNKGKALAGLFMLIAVGVAFAASTATDIRWSILQGGVNTEELSLTATALRPVTDGGLDLGTGANSFNDLVLNGDATVGGAAVVTGAVSGASGAFVGVVTAGSFTGSVVRTAQEYIINGGGKPGATKGWVTTGTAVNLFNYTLPASISTTATMVIPISGLHVGDTITAWKLVGQIESAGGTVELDGDLRKITTVAAANTDASVGAIVGINVVADTAVATAKTGLTEVVAANETFYVLLSGTTAGSTDIDIQGVTVTVTTN